MADDYTSDPKLPSKKDPTPVGTGTNLPYIGSCYDYYSWLSCAKLHAGKSGALYHCVLGNLLDNFGNPIINTTPNAGNPSALYNQVFGIFFDAMWSNPGNNSGYLDQANTCCSPNFGLPYHNGCVSFDIKIGHWLNVQSNLQGHVPATYVVVTPGGIPQLSTPAHTIALSGTNAHYQWWRTFYKIQWAEDMQRCCNCGEWYNPTHGKKAAPTGPMDGVIPIREQYEGPTKT